jgi:hypothetical protein
MALRGRLIHGWIIVMTQGLLDTGAARVARSPDERSDIRDFGSSPQGARRSGNKTFF